MSYFQFYTDIKTKSGDKCQFNVNITFNHNVVDHLRMYQHLPNFCNVMLYQCHIFNCIQIYQNKVWGQMSVQHKHNF